MERQGAPEPGLINDVRRDVGDVEGEYRNIERKDDQHDANKYENRAEENAQKERQDYNQGRYP
jgi:translation initiation factor 2 beta subunit (eIF-2beta)/eIF-5